MELTAKSQMRPGGVAGSRPGVIAGVKRVVAILFFPFMVFGESARAQDSTKYSIFKGLPLKPQRTIRFTTTEASWTSLDVSPDGKTIVFDLLGDLYTVPIGG